VCVCVLERGHMAQQRDELTLWTLRVDVCSRVESIEALVRKEGGGHVPQVALEQ
jgi:hypothetical protein